jgi:GNAT superfamily N-acetyltransferase
VVDVAGSVEGVFIGVTHQLWYSRKKQSTDLFFYVTDKGRGWGSSLLRAYIRWARMNKGVAEITLGITSGIGDMNRTRQLYERMGAIKMGDSFILPKEA